MATDRITLGIDLGTQSVRVIAASQDGQVLGSASRPLASRRQAERHVQDPRQWWNAAIAACREAIGNLPSDRIGAVAVDGTSGTVLLTDADGNPLTMAVMYDDARATRETTLINSFGAEIWASLGYQRMQSSWGLPKLLWLVQKEKELNPKCRLAHQADFINRRLAGQQVATDWSNSLKSGYDLVNQLWPRDLFTSFYLSPWLFPDVVAPGTVIGAVCHEAAELTGIPKGTAIVAGMTDGCASQIAAGALSVGSWNCVLGTTLVLKGVTSQLLLDPNGAIYCHRSPEGNWLPGGASNTGAAILGERFAGRDLNELASQAVERLPTDVLIYPLRGRGERFPFFAPEAEIFVTKNPSDEIELFAALLQAVAFTERLCFDYLDSVGAPIDGRLTFTGGAAANIYWNQIRADILHHPVHVPEITETAFGMAILAASAGRSLGPVAEQMVRYRQVFDPREGDWFFAEPYGRFVDELARRGWLSEPVAEHARKRAEKV